MYTLKLKCSFNTSLHTVSKSEMLDPLVFASKNDKNKVYMGKQYDVDILRELGEPVIENKDLYLENDCKFLGYENHGNTISVERDYNIAALQDLEQNTDMLFDTKHF